MPFGLLGRDQQRPLDGELAFIESSSDDRTRTANVPDCPQVVQRCDPARRNDRAQVAANESFVKGQIGPIEKSVALNRRNFEGRHAGFGQEQDGGRSVDPIVGGCPTVPDRATITNIDGHRDTIGAMDRDEATSKVRIAQRRRPDGDPCCSGSEGEGHRCLVPQTAGHLHIAPATDPRNDRADDRSVYRVTAPRAVKIDDMKPAGTRIGKPASDLDGIIAVRRLPIEVALAQSDDAAIPQVDGGKDLEGACFAHGNMLTY